MLFGPGDRPPPPQGGGLQRGGGLQGGGRYIDDVIIGSTREAEGRLLANHDQNVRSVLDHLKKEELWSRSAKPISLCVGRVVENVHPVPHLVQCSHWSNGTDLMTFVDCVVFRGSQTTAQGTSKLVLALPLPSLIC